jgi:hypothetical protein
MKRTVFAVSWVAVASVVLAACGGGGSGDSGPGTAGLVQDFSASAQAISSAASNYGTKASVMTDRAACTADQAAYEAQVRPLLEQMRSGSGAMDQQMSSMGRAADADMTCGMEAITAELDLHASIACASPTDMGPNESEAARHVQVITAWADHQRVRAEQMGSSMGMGGMPGGTTTGTCQPQGDGAYTMMNGPARPAVTGMMVSGFHAGAEEIAAAVTRHGVAAAGMSDVAACRADETSYDAVVRPMVNQMRVLASPMDETMRSMGGPGASGDMQCGADAMRWELDRHASLACASTGDMGPNRTEDARHVQAMTSWTDHQRVRSEQMGSTMGMGGMPGGGTTATCQRNADGSYTLPGGGGMMP